MARNKVQFHKGLSLGDFLKDYGTQKQCFNALDNMALARGVSLCTVSS